MVFKSMAFTQGHKLAHGGARNGAGRKADEFKSKARKIGDPLKILQFYWDVANGKELEQVVTDGGVSIAVPAPVKDRLKAGELYLDRVIGKVTQVISGEDGGPLTIKVVNYSANNDPA